MGEGSFTDIICLRIATPLSGLSIIASSLYAGMCLELTNNITSASLRKREPSYREQSVCLFALLEVSLLRIAAPSLRRKTFSVFLLKVCRPETHKQKKMDEKEMVSFRF